MRTTLRAIPGLRSRSSVGPVRRPMLGPLDASLVALGSGLGAITIAAIAVPGLPTVVVDREVDLVINSAATIIAVGVAGLGWVRYRETGRVSTLLQASAFLALGATNGFFVVLVLLGQDGVYGSSLGAAGQAPIYGWSSVRLLVAAILLSSVVVDPATARLQGARERLAFLAPTIAAIGALLMLGLAEGALRPLVLVDPSGGLPSILPEVRVVALITGLLLLVATISAYRRARSGGRAEGHLAVGLLIATFGQIHLAIYPATFTDLVTTEDLLRTAFGAALLMGIAAQQRGDLHELRSAHADLARYRDAEVERAAIEERARLAREFHDGLAQHLWAARLHHARLGDRELLSPAARLLWQETADSLERALRSARDALQAMRSLEDDAPFNEALSRELERFEDRTGIRIILDGDPGPLAIPPSRRKELLRIVGEALANVERHADATVVRVQVHQQGASLLLELADNGGGFEPQRRSEGRFGLIGMSERALLLGGTLAIESQPLAGTRIRVSIPIAEAA